MINFSSLKGKIAVVTGGYGHLGRAICKVLSECGVIVYVAGRSELKFLASDLENCIFLNLDLTKSSSIKKAFDKVDKKHDRLDILINNAYYGLSNHPEKMTDEEWEYGIDGSINGVYRCLKRAIPFIKKSQQGRIINVASMYGVVAPDFSIYEEAPKLLNPPNYGAGKAAIIQITKYYAVFLAKYGITVNAISPGAFPSLEVQQNKDFILRLTEKIPLKRIGKPEDLSGIVALLASGESSYITGQNILIDGGWTTW